VRKSAACLLLALAPFHAALAQTAAPASTNLSFSGTGASETTPFTIAGRWEVQWNGSPLNVTVEQSDGTIVAGATSMGPGSIFVASGGTYKVRLSSNFPAPWHISVVTMGAPGSVATAGMGVYVPPDMTATPGSGSSPNAAGAGGPQVTRAGAQVAPDSGTSGTLTTTAPISTTPASTPAAAPAAAAKLTDAEARAVVVIKGDNAEGTGFLVKTATGPMVITNQHVLEANPHLQITTSDGQTVKFTGLQGASDRDLAMIPIQDNNYSYLQLATDVGSTVQVGDEVVTPGNSEGGDVLLNTDGHVVALGPQKVEISNPIYHGNSGGPIFHVKSGTVIGVVTEAQKVDTGDELDKASFASHDSAITAGMRYFGLRLDTVPQWETYVWQNFENETEFLREFHERSKCLDSYLNTANNDTTEWGLYYLKDDKVKMANDQAGDMANGGDTSQRMEAERDLIFSLDGVADSNMDQIQVSGNFYPYDQQRARDEIEYRQALKKEISGMTSDVNRISGLARLSN
jgi:S1-C subfamily serine protease